MRSTTAALTALLAATLTTAPGAATPITLTTAKVTVDGNSTLHPWTASSTTVNVIAVELAAGGEGDVLEQALEPGALKAFAVAIPVLSLSSPKDGIDKNMHKALKVEQHAEITYRLRALVAEGGGYKAVGLLTVAGVEREASLQLQIQRKGASLAITGTTDLFMTDYAIQPPKAMLGMLKTDPKVQIRIELELGVATT